MLSPVGDEEMASGNQQAPSPHRVCWRAGQSQPGWPSFPQLLRLAYCAAPASIPSAPHSVCSASPLRSWAAVPAWLPCSHAWS